MKDMKNSLSFSQTNELPLRDNIEYKEKIDGRINERLTQKPQMYRSK